MLPLDPNFLLFLKFFVVVTCVVFWLRLGLRGLMRDHHPHSYRRHYCPHGDEEVD